MQILFFVVYLFCRYFFSAMTNPLPAFLAKREQGLMLDPAKLDSTNSFFDFVESLFSNGARFSGLDYSVFLDILYAPEKLNRLFPSVRLAREIIAFPLHRQTLYKSVRTLENDSIAEYFFEPATIEVPYEHPVYGPALEDGTTPIVGYEQRTKTQSTLLDIDEFIAAMWIKGVRYGLQIPVIAHAIAENKSNRLVVARKLAPIPGKDAGVIEEFEGLRQDNTPVIVDGKADLKRFKNRYPQVAKGCRMLRKVPMQKGVLGVTVRGERLEPTIPKDLDLGALAGAGTRVETSQDGLVLVSTMVGFICIEDGSGIVNVVEKIEAKGDITAKHTGDLDLAVDEFIAHGEVQEGRVVKGKHMRFTAAVYGNLISEGGCIELLDNFSGGHARIQGPGSLSAAKRTYNVRIEAHESHVALEYAENSTIIGSTVNIGHAVNCIILANNVRIKNLQACHVAANSLDIAITRDRRGFPVRAVVLLPDSVAAERQKKTYEESIEHLGKQITEKNAQLLRIKNEPDFAKYLAARQAVQAGKIQMTPAIEERLTKLQRIHVGAFKSIERLVGEIKATKKQIEDQTQSLQLFLVEQEAKAAEHNCFITEVAGETEVVGKVAYSGIATLVQKTNNELLRWMQMQGADDVKIFYSESGTLAWQHSLTEKEAVS